MSNWDPFLLETFCLSTNNDHLFTRDLVSSMGLFWEWNLLEETTTKDGEVSFTNVYD